MGKKHYKLYRLYNMTRPPLKDGKQKLFYLDTATIEKIKELSHLEMMSESQYIDFLIAHQHGSMTTDTKINSLKLQLKEISFKKDNLEKQALFIKDKLNILYRKLDSQKKYVELTSEAHEKQKNDFVFILTNKLSAGDTLEAERVAKNHEQILGKRWSAEQLLLEAQKALEKRKAGGGV